MNKALKSIFKFLVRKRYIGGRHFPEEKLVKSRTKWLTREEIKGFEKEYKQAKLYLLRSKKRTGKGTDWHISINPKYLDEIENLLELE